MERSLHAATCLGYGGDRPQLLVTGGRDKFNMILNDVWILDLASGRWREVRREGGKEGGREGGRGERGEEGGRRERGREGRELGGEWGGREGEGEREGREGARR